MVVWPTIGATSLGRLVGRMCGVKAGIGPIRLGRLLAVAAIPAALTAFAWQLLPFVARRYRLTNCRIVVQKGLAPSDGPAVGLDEFDAIRVEVLPGQEWLGAGELVLLHGDREVLRLSGVSRPIVFREVCLKARAALIGVRQVLETQAAAAG